MTQEGSSSTLLSAPLSAAARSSSSWRTWPGWSPSPMAPSFGRPLPSSPPWGTGFSGQSSTPRTSASHSTDCGSTSPVSALTACTSPGRYPACSRTTSTLPWSSCWRLGAPPTTRSAAPEPPVHDGTSTWRQPVPAPEAWRSGPFRLGSAYSSAGGAGRRQGQSFHAFSRVLQVGTGSAVGDGPSHSKRLPDSRAFVPISTDGLLPQDIALA